MSSSVESVNTKNQPPPSPWKKPKVVSLSRSKSLKRKTEVSNLNLEVDNDDLAQPQPKITRNIFSRFSVGASLTNTSSFPNDVPLFIIFYKLLIYFL